jgi:peptidoglycan/LPS O-acetylase OafA/YrhL
MSIAQDGRDLGRDRPTLADSAIVLTAQRADTKAAAAADLPALTGVRFLLALWVVLYHDERIVVGDQGYVPLLYQGHLGVDGFFLISGFILAHVYGGRFAAHESGLYRHFLWARLARIWPAYAVALLFWTWLWQLLCHLAMVQSWGIGDIYIFNLPAWSLSAEWAAYLLFPLVMLLSRRFSRTPARLAAIAGAFAALYAVCRLLGCEHLDQPGVFGMPRLAAEFFVGVMLRSFGTPARRDDHAGDIAALAGLAGTLLVLPTMNGIAPLLGEVLALPLLALTIWGCSRSGPIMSRLLANPALLFLGAASYSIYLVQWPVAEIFGLAGGRLGIAMAPWWPPALAVIATAGTLAAGCLLYIAVERPARAALRRLA